VDEKVRAALEKISSSLNDLANPPGSGNGKREFKLTSMLIIMKFKKNTIKVDEGSSVKSSADLSRLQNEYEALKKEKEKTSLELSRVKLESQDLNAKYEELRKKNESMASLPPNVAESKQSIEEQPAPSP